MDWSSLFAAIAAGVALAALIKSHFDSQARSIWESDQTTRRENFEKCLSDKQHNWQREQEQQRRREREEDIKRERERITPQLRVSVNLGYRSWGINNVHTINIRTQNIGQMTVFIDAPSFREVGGSNIHTMYEQVVTPRNWPTANISIQPFPMTLYPTQGDDVNWVKENFVQYLREQRLGKFEMEAVVRDGAGKLYTSDPFTLDISEETYSLNIPKAD